MGPSHGLAPSCSPRRRMGRCLPTLPAPWGCQSHLGQARPLRTDQRQDQEPALVPACTELRLGTDLCLHRLPQRPWSSLQPGAQDQASGWVSRTPPSRWMRSCTLGSCMCWACQPCRGFRRFFFSEQNLGRSRAEATRELVAKLNEAVQVCVYTGDITEELLQDFQVVVLTASSLEEQLKVGTLCRKHGVCFLVADTRGLVGQLFCDFGENFTVQDLTEEEPQAAAIQHISQGSPGILTLREDAHNFHDGDLVTFSGIEGMVELNGCASRPIRVQEDGTLEIGDTTTFSSYLRGGAVTEVKRPKTVRHEPLCAALLQPRVVVQNPQEVHRAHCLHQAFRALHEFQRLSGRPPQPWDPADAERVVGLARGLKPLRGTKGEPLEEPLDEALVWTVALSSAGVLSPMAAVVGAVAAQEVLKAVSRKFLPLDQWLYFDALDCLPDDEQLLPKPEDCKPRRCRYDGQIAVFGASFQEKLSRQHYLLVGAGAIGCELLKGFALMGLGLQGRGAVTVADMDHVERSNLSRQFLFRPEDIGRPKAEVAAKAACHLNSDLQVNPLTHPLEPSTEHIYGDNFFSLVDGVAAALDSFQARHYVAARCTHYLKPLLEAGTQGTRGSASVFMPFVTEGYRGPLSEAEASEDAPHPVCSVRHFPSTAGHTLQWARDEFEGLFCRSAETINCHQEALASLADGEPRLLPLLQVAVGVLRQRPRNWQDCVLWALGHWQLRFRQGVEQLLRHHPPDEVLEDGTHFWSRPRQCPQPLEFDASQDTHLIYVLAAANLYARMHGLLGSQDQPALREMLQSLLLPDPQHPDPIFPNDLTSTEPDPEQMERLREALRDWSTGSPLEPLRFEKDDDSNFHMDFVTAAASLRAQNYGIPPASRAQSKRIVGQIIPAIATTTAAVAGLMGLELFKVVGGPRPLSAFRHSYLRLAENYFSRYRPRAPATQKFHHLSWTCWDRLKVTAGQPERTLKSLLDHIQEQHGLRVKMLLQDNAVLYSAGWPPEMQAQCLPLRVTEWAKQKTHWVPRPGQQVLVLTLSCEGEEDDTTFPPLHYELRQSGSPTTSVELCVPSPQ
ncbi:ubiquitin-like modifier-activating enzyme 7 isoform X2 [Artibeus jamaicensis]|uniref:ubiquitin-like modifier-activating enzyme 7 isoform X2 n=1 Tax=Artibeus jamaicensis TaxID=9417 RepID=UPI00235A6FE1|nr:ubiquitin-like modifier-activating enzyme 7 isoform X2 [Artibeus jamaicensis]